MFSKSLLTSFDRCTSIYVFKFLLLGVADASNCTTTHTKIENSIISVWDTIEQACIEQESAVVGAHSPLSECRSCILLRDKPQVFDNNPDKCS